MCVCVCMYMCSSFEKAKKAKYVGRPLESIDCSEFCVGRKKRERLVVCAV